MRGTAVKEDHSDSDHSDDEEKHGKGGSSDEEEEDKEGSSDEDSHVKSSHKDKEYKEFLRYKRSHQRRGRGR